MRILHAIHDFLPAHAAGSEIYAFNLCRELAKRHVVHVVAAEYRSLADSRHSFAADARRPAGHRDRQQLAWLVRGLVAVAPDWRSTRPSPSDGSTRRTARSQLVQPELRTTRAGTVRQHRCGRHSSRLHAGLPGRRAAPARDREDRVRDHRIRLAAPAVSPVQLFTPKCRWLPRSARPARRARGWGERPNGWQGTRRWQAGSWLEGTRSDWRGLCPKRPLPNASRGSGACLTPFRSSLPRRRRWHRSTNALGFPPRSCGCPITGSCRCDVALTGLSGSRGRSASASLVRSSGIREPTS